MNQDMGWIENHVSKRGVRLTAKGRKWAENTEAILFYAVLLLAFGIAGSIETGKWF